VTRASGERDKGAGSDSERHRNDTPSRRSGKKKAPRPAEGLKQALCSPRRILVRKERGLPGTKPPSTSFVMVLTVRKRQEDGIGRVLIRPFRGGNVPLRLYRPAVDRERRRLLMRLKMGLFELRQRRRREKGRSRRRGTLHERGKSR